MNDERGTKGLFLLRPRCIEAERPRNPYANQSTTGGMILGGEELSPG
jgi:hypothetical protein